MSDAAARAHATLRRGALFLGAGLRLQDMALPPGAIAGRYRAKVIGNGLRELDRFLNVLIDEASLCLGLPAAPGQRNTANKLHALRETLGLGHEHDSQLRALGRSRDCLFYCNGVVKQRGVTAGWPAPDGPRRFAVGEDLVVTPADLAGICGFYEGIAAELVGYASGTFTSPRTARLD